MAQSNNSKSPPYNFLVASGNMAKLIREYNWENTVLGSPSNWSSSLKNTISMMLHSRFPIILLGGDDYIQFFNDVYHQVLGNSTKHNAIKQI